MTTITIEGPRAKAVGPFDLEFYKTIACLSGRKVWSGSKVVSFDATAVNLKAIRAAVPQAKWDDASGKFAMLEELGNLAKQDAVAARAVSSWKPALTLRDHQQRCIDLSWERREYALLFEMGLGKTATLIANAGMLFAAGKIDAVLIVAPKGVDAQWINSEIPLHSDKNYSINCVLWNGKGYDVKAFTKPNTLHYYAMNVDALIHKGGPAATKFIERFDGRVMMIVDESHAIKSGIAQRTKAAIAIGTKCAYRRISTGTPIARSIEDAWSQFMFLNPDILGHKYITSFRRRYCIMGGFEGRQVVGQQRVDEFNGLIAPHSFRLTKAEAVDLPAKIYVKRIYEMGADVKRHFKLLKSQLMTELSDGSVLTVANAASKMMRLQQATCGQLPQEDGTLEYISDERIEQMLQIVEQVEGPVVVWARFKADIARIAAALARAYPDAGVVTYYGDTNKRDRDAAVVRFKSGAARFFVSNPASGGTGLNLQGACQSVIYYSNDYNALSRWQSEDRTHRMGMRGSVTYFDIVAKGSIDNLILSNLDRKKSLSDLTLDDIRRALTEQ